MALQCRHGFIHAAAGTDEYELVALVRSASAPELTKPSLDSACGARAKAARQRDYVKALLNRVAATFPEHTVEEGDPQVVHENEQRVFNVHVEDTGATNIGSLAHPECCARPCVRFAKSSCINSQNCQYCHGDHTNGFVKFDKRQRHCWDRLSEQQQIINILPHLSARIESKELTDVMQPILQYLTQRLQQLPPAQPLSRFKQCMLGRALSRMQVARVMELLETSQQIDPALGQAIRTSFVDVRQGITVQGRS